MEECPSSLIAFLISACSQPKRPIIKINTSNGLWAKGVLSLFPAKLDHQIKDFSTMASMELKEQFEQQTEKKLMVENCQAETGSNDVTKTDDANLDLVKATVDIDKVSETSIIMDLSSSRPHHRRLPAELNREIYLCFNLATRRKFIWGLGWDFYAMFRHILLTKTKRLCNPQANGWKAPSSLAHSDSKRFVRHGVATISPDGLNAQKIKNKVATIYAMKGFPISGESYRADHFPGTICYYYEVTELTGVLCQIGLTDGLDCGFTFIGCSANSYGLVLDYKCYLAGEDHHFGTLRQEHNENGKNVYGCGLLLDPNDNLAIFFTLNGKLNGQLIPINPSVDTLFPSVTMLGNISSLEANFGGNPAKNFDYDIKNCPGMGLGNPF